MLIQIDKNYNLTRTFCGGCGKKWDGMLLATQVFVILNGQYLLN